MSENNSLPQDENAVEENVTVNEEVTEVSNNTVSEETITEEIVSEDGTKKTKKKKRIRRKYMTPEQRKKRRIKDILITAGVFFTIGMFFAITVLTGFIGEKNNYKVIDKITSVAYAAGEQLIPEQDTDTGYWTFTTDRDFVILQLTDLHFGVGGFSFKRDKMAIDAVSTIVQRVKPDLVIITGDMVYPVPFQAGTINNKKETEMVIALFEQLGVFWTVCFGNHDSEVYSTNNREQISALYASNTFANNADKYCIYQEGPSDIFGCGNQIINVKNSVGLITQSIVVLDSNAYVDGSILHDYDNIHEDQVVWYEEQITALNDKNQTAYENLTSGEITTLAGLYNKTEAELAADGIGNMIKSLAFFHIPVHEYDVAWKQYAAQGYQNVAGSEVNYIDGFAYEVDEKVACGKYRDQDIFFEHALALGSTQGMFVGHDHINVWAVEYKGILLTYGMSIDHLAYFGIQNETEQRGGTVITVSADTSFDMVRAPLVSPANPTLKTA